MTSQPDRYLSAEDIAAELGVHLQTVQKFFRTGGLPGRKIGHGWRTTRDAFDAWLTNQPADDTSPALPPLETK